MAGQFTIYRDNAALQANLQPARWKNDQGWEIEKGAVWIEVANGVVDAKGSWDWSHKIVWKIGTADIEKILAGWKEDSEGRRAISLVHKDQNENISVLRISPGTGKYVDTYSLMFKRGEITVTVFADKGQWVMFCKLLSDSYMDVIGWRLAR